MSEEKHILWEVDYKKLKGRALYVAANEENFKKLLKILEKSLILYYCNFERGLAEFCDVSETIRTSLIYESGNIRVVGRVHELYIDSDCEIYATMAVYVPLCNLPGSKQFEVIDIEKLTLQNKVVWEKSN